jgi:NAD(P)-dependent dehydrogenase (short-subunit alcohol dehydrogenase family)
MTWTVERIRDLTGKVAVVTGANNGIGLEVTRELARHGAAVILACRSEARGQAAIQSIRTSVPNARIQTRRLDLASLASIRQFAAMFRGSYDQLNLLINNAGVLLVPYGTTADGF